MLPIMSMDKMVMIYTFGHIKVDMPKLNTLIIWTSIFERYVTNWYQEDMCTKEIGIRTQNILGILGLIINMIVETYTTT